MARHADARSGRRAAPGRRPLRVSAPTVAVCVLVIAAVALGVWWWNLRSASDPISADPVDAYATVVSSPDCPGGGGTTVRISGIRPAVDATLSGCGYTTGQRLAVQYLRGHPDQIRLAGTSVAGSSGLSGKLLPIGILAAGLIAVLAVVALLVDRRRSRHLASGRGISVAEIRRRGLETVAESAAAEQGSGLGTGRRSAETGDPADVRNTRGRVRAGDLSGRESGGDDVTGRGTDGDGTSGDGIGGDGTSGDGIGGDGVDSDAAGDDGVGADLADIDPGEPSHVLPGGFVIVDEQLFTHSGTEVAPAPPGDGRGASPEA